jgi:hypothetical protein
MGYMPDTFKDFLNIMGIPKAKTTQTENNIPMRPDFGVTPG